MVGAKSQRALATPNPLSRRCDAIERWLQRLGLGTEIAVMVLMGGDEADLFPERDVVLIGTQDKSANSKWDTKP
jgi:hypothetical protein